MTGTPLVLAGDLGSTTLRAALVAPDGALVAQASRAAPTPQGSAGVSEADPDAWWRGFASLAGQLARAAPEAFRDIAGIALCGATRVQIFVDGDGAPVRAAMLWGDTRATEESERLRAMAGDHPEARHLNAFHPLARLAWLARHEPGDLARTVHVLDPKDYVHVRLTGRMASDPVSLARLAACETQSLMHRALGRSGLTPPLLEPWERIGVAQAGLPAPLGALAGTPVFCGAHDTFAAVLGLGAMRAGYVYNISGTTEVLGLLSDAPANAEGLIGLDWRVVHQLGGPSQNGADVAAWLARILDGGPDAAGTLERALAGPRTGQPLLFLPYLSGERVPYWDADLRGAFVGLARAHGPADLAQSVLEGVAFQNRSVLERAEAALGRKTCEIRFGGGGAANPAWPQIKADVLNRPIVLTSADEPGLVGAAALAFAGLGHFATLDQAQDAMARISRRYEPDPVRAARYDRLFALFRQAETALTPLSHALAAFR